MKPLLCLVLFVVALTSCSDDPEAKFYSTFELESPQLGATRTIWVYLPGDYQQSESTYPVIYMSDGQWIFETNPNYSQEMHVDEMMRELESEGFGGAIVVGIESDEETRADEFGLYFNPYIGFGGKGDKYLDFLVNTVKERIDNEYRTKADRENTYVMGASLGGLGAFYALTEYPDVFGGATLFSAALHFNRDSVFAKAIRKEIRPDAKIYGVVGKNEVTTEVDFPKDNQTLFEILQGKTGNKNFKLVIHDDGEHRIWFWEREFPKAIDFLFN